MFGRDLGDLSVSTSDHTGIRFLYVSEGDWSARCDRVMEAERLEGISFGSGVRDQMGVLARYPALRLIYLASASTGDIERLQEFACLEDLRIVDASGRRTDDLRFPRLRAFGGDYHPSLAGVLANASLEHVNLSGPPGPDLTGWPELPHLQTLRLGSGRRLLTLDGVEQFPALTRLKVAYQTALQDVGMLARVRSLRSIEFHVCRGLRDLEWVKPLTGLRELRMYNCGEIASVAPLAGHPALETLVLSDTTISDGDTTPILQMPSLTKVQVKRHRGYEPSADEVEMAVRARLEVEPTHDEEFTVTFHDRLPWNTRRMRSSRSRRWARGSDR